MFEEKTAKSWPAPVQPGGRINKEHSRTTGGDAQEVKPSTPEPNAGLGHH